MTIRQLKNRRKVRVVMQIMTLELGEA
jgi:hypothetical protein